MTTGDTIGMGDFETVHLAGGSAQRLAGATIGEALDAIAVPAKATLADAERTRLTETYGRQAVELFGGMSDTSQEWKSNYLLKWHAIRH